MEPELFPLQMTESPDGENLTALAPGHFSCLSIESQHSNTHSPDGNSQEPKDMLY